MTDTPLSDDVVETVLGALLVEIDRQSNGMWPVDGLVDMEVDFDALARAALEAARYGEIVGVLNNALTALDAAHREAVIAIREFDGGEVNCTQFSAVADETRALLSSIGVSQP